MHRKTSKKWFKAKIVPDTTTAAPVGLAQLASLTAASGVAPGLLSSAAAPSVQVTSAPAMQSLLELQVSAYCDAGGPQRHETDYVLCPHCVMRASAVALPCCPTEPH